MSYSKTAKRYAKAILDWAVDKNAADAVNADMGSITETIADSSELLAFLNNPTVKDADKKKALVAIFKNANTVTVKLIDLLIENRRIGLLGEVAKKYVELYELKNERNIAQLTTAVALTKELEKELLVKIKKLTGRTVSIENCIDPDIIGGFVLRLGDLQYDTSIASNLKNIKREFTSNN